MFQNDHDSSDMPTTEKIPVALIMRPYWDNEYIFTQTSIIQANCWQHFYLGTHFCRTNQTNWHHYSKDIVNKNLEKGTTAFYKTNHDNKIIACKCPSIKDKASNTPKVLDMLNLS